MNWSIRFLKVCELLGIVGLDQRLPVLDDGQQTFVEFQQAFAVFLHGLNVRDM